MLLGACSQSTQPPAPGDGAEGDSDRAGDRHGDGIIPICTGTAEVIRVGSAQTLDPIVESPDRCLVYGADRTGSEVYFVDTIEDRVRQVVAVGSQPTDLTLSADGEQLYVAVKGAQKIVALDAQTGAILTEVVTTLPPFRIASGTARRVFYVEEEIFSAVREVNLVNGLDTQITGVDFHEPDLESSADGTVLYVGEANQPGSRLFALDAGQPGLPELDVYRFDGGFTLPSPQRRIYLAENATRIFFADRAFQADNLTRMRGWLGDQVVATTRNGDIVATDEFVHDGKTFVSFSARPHPGGGVLFSADRQWLYEFDPVGSLLRRTPLSTLIGVHRLGETNVPAGSLASHNFNQLLADPNRDVIYALDAQQNQLVFIDRNSLLPIRAEIIGSAPTDMSIHPGGDTMAVATFGATEIAIVDLANETKALKFQLFVPGNPFRVALTGNRLVYSEQDQFSAMTLVNAMTGVELHTLDGAIFQPDVEFDPTGRYLYAGEAAGPSARLFRYDLMFDIFDEVDVTADTYSYPARKVIFHGGAIYYAGRKFDAFTLDELGAFGEEIVLVTPDGRFAVSRRRFYDTTTFAEVGGLPTESDLLTVHPNGQIIYQFDNSTGALFVQAL